MSTRARHVGNLFRNVEQVGDCWLWTGRLRSGYGVHTGGRMAYKVMYELLVGDVPDGLELDHLCRTPRCVFPDHLEPVTHKENSRRRSLAHAKGERCKSGRHEFTPENTFFKRGGRRLCRACHEERGRNYYESTLKAKRAIDRAS